ncbi:uncharacterized protein LOC119603147 [Lucilia sericata]|uniref:uncharacterized protein LOC119603147 n=1 Tax=Lucilia sericata TaxID=13632 RepID=UPI0018A86EAA|nr:uncharacterized protein LOC119603147 [Lucilia sericata]
MSLDSVHTIEVHRGELKSNWNRIKVAYENFLSDIEKEADQADDPIDVESFKAKYKNTYTTYCNCMKKLSEISSGFHRLSLPHPELVLPNISTSNAAVSTIPAPSNSSREFIPNSVSSDSYSFHLPPVEIETFHGDYASWPTFRDMFTAVVSNTRASNVGKLFFLTRKTTGEAREIVQKSPLTNQGFDLAWSNLCSRYENRRILVNGQLKILFNLKASHSESGNALKQLQGDINSCISILKLYNIDVESWDPIFVFLCTSKLPENTLTLWEQQLKDKTSIPKWLELNEFLTNRYRTLESVSEIRGSNCPKTNDPKTKNSTTSNKKVHSFITKLTLPKCQLCPKDEHTIRKCPKFLEMSYPQRLNEIKKEDKAISRFWEVENLQKKNFLSPSDQACEELYVQTTRMNSDGRYIVSLPLKDGFPNNISIGHSRSSAMAQFLRNEARLIRNADLKLEYDKVVREYEELGHMTKVDSPNMSQNNVYYLPHHAVVKPESVTTKVRVVFNASSPSSNGLSLNSVLHVGPILQNDLTLLILRWRFFEFVFNADIQKMYRQILVDPRHTPYQRILFRDNPNSLVGDYELKTVTFGVNCAPYLAIRTVLQLADDVRDTFPIASSILRNSMCVDDVLAGAHSKRDAILAKTELILALQSAGFELRKWTSNSVEILEDISKDHLIYEDFLRFEDNSSAKSLGIRWNAHSDEFYFDTNKFDLVSEYTKREVLSRIAKLFDPAGWLAPCIILAKILMQKIWIDGTDWDESLLPETLSQWKSFEDSYPLINSIRIPRWIGYIPNADVQFHGFCDASEKAYAAALYIRISTNGVVQTNLISSKTKVAPIKTLSIPRLELCGALLLAEMIENLLPSLDVDNYTVSCWTDSTIVISWLAKPPCNWLTFVANRVSKIIQIVPFSRWSHVSSEDNPADLVSRGISPQELKSSELWWFGPSWLKHSSSKWPSQNLSKIPITDLEVKTIRTHFTYFSDFDNLLERFSSFSRAMRVMAYVYRFFYRTHPSFRSNFYKDSTLVTSSEIISIRDKLISVCQKAAFPNDYKALSARQNLPKSSGILNLNPFLDPEGLIRSCGRLELSSELSYNEKHPIIIPYNSKFARFLVKFIHDITLHGGNQLVLRLLRSQYWIPKAKNLIKATINNCKTCVIYKRRCQRQMMAALPPERCEVSRPFTHTGLDFAGPFDIKSYSGRGCRMTKGYVCVFVCFSTKAIHLEATSDLSTPVFLAAFSRFVSRRGCPLHLYSDNGTNFVGASRTLAKEFIQTTQQRIQANYAHQNVTWHFIPAGAPHMGGLWEVGVKSFKSHFRKTAGNFKYTHEELSTLLSKIESCLNSRPFSPMSTDPTDLCALTPGHFLIGSPLLTPIDPQINESSISMTNRWQRLKLVHQHFCQRWKNEYLKELHKRIKWQTPERNLQEGALVVIKDENLPPNSWRLGRVTKIYPGPDKRVRVAEVLTHRGIITRPIVKLILLPTES